MNAGVRRWLGRAPRVLLAALAFAVGEGLAVRASSSHGADSSSWQALKQTWRAFALVELGGVFVALSLAAASAAASAGVERLERAELWSGAPRLARTDLAASGLVVVPATLGALFELQLASARLFKNQDLAALGLAALAFALSAAACFAWAVGAALARALRERGTPRAVAFAPGVIATALVAARWGAVNRGGFAQLDPWLLAGPALAAAVWVLTAGERIRRRFASVALSRWLTLFGLVVGAFSLPVEKSAATLGRHGAWSAFAIRGLRLATDFDHDGYSGWFAGGDCRPFDALVHPGARELAANGVDDNCLGGDAKPGAPLPAPRRTTFGKGLGLGGANVVIVTVETLRADRTSLLGYSLPTTPRLVRLAEGGAVFERLYATTPTTRLSLPALLSGVLPSRLDWIPQAASRQMRRLGARAPWLPEILRGKGYATLAVHADFRAFTAVESAGFDRGFERWDTSTRLSARGGTMRGFPGGAQIDRALELVDAVEGRPFLLWVHLFEPHYAYEQSPDVPKFGSSEAALYAADLAEADRQIGRLLDGLAARGRFERSVVLVAGDHGEEFGEHGERWHGSNLYEPQVRTAAVLRLPGVAARRVPEAVSLVDFMPTLLDALGVDADFGRLEGRNLLPILLGRERGARPFFLESFRVDSGAEYRAALVDFPHKLVYAEDGGTLELYDLARDPAERRDRYDPADPAAQTLANRLYQYLESGRPNP